MFTAYMENTDRADKRRNILLAWMLRCISRKKKKDAAVGHKEQMIKNIYTSTFSKIQKRGGRMKP